MLRVDRVLDFILVLEPRCDFVGFDGLLEIAQLVLSLDIDLFEELRIELTVEAGRRSLFGDVLCETHDATDKAVEDLFCRLRASIVQGHEEAVLQAHDDAYHDGEGYENLSRSRVIIALVQVNDHASALFSVGFQGRV